MKIRTRIFLSNMLLFGLGFYILTSWISTDLKPEYRKATEEPLVDSARILASVVAATSKDGEIDVSTIKDAFDSAYDQRFSAPIYDYLKKDVDYRVYVTDKNGKVLFHSTDEGLVGADFSAWNDVELTLRGEYGARTSRDLPDNPFTSIMYIGAPIIVNGQTIGVLTLGKPTTAANIFASRSRQLIEHGALVVGFLVILVSFLLAGMLTRPIQRLTAHARAVRDGKRAKPPPPDRSEIGELGKAFEEMRDALEGKQYVEHYVQTLTHEVKSPIAAIRGAAELMKEDMSKEQRARFLANIESEAGRVQGVVEELLLLSSLESMKAITEVETLDLSEIADDALLRLRPIIEKKDLRVEFENRPKAVFEGDRFLVSHAILNLIMNAIEFSPEGGDIKLHVRRRDDDAVEFSVSDRGPGVPDYALGRVHERFYSLKRPDTGRKSSGLGLTLVREVAELHGGLTTLENSPGGGAVATLRLPSRHKTVTS